MFSGLDDVDWSSMHHAYGTAEEVPGLLRAMASANADVREEALSRFYSAVHHQGDVTRCTTATVPFLFEMAAARDLPDRAAVVRLLVSIGTEAIERYGHAYMDYGGEESNHALAADLIRDEAELFISFAGSDDAKLRSAALPALAQFIEDAPRAVALLRDRLPAATGIMERLLIVQTMADLAQRLPAAVDLAIAWFDELAADTGGQPEVRLAALAQRTRCAPDRLSPEVIPATTALLREIAGAPIPPEEWAGPTRKKPPVTGVPPQVAEAFEQPERFNTVFAPTTGLLRTFHEALGTRVPERSALLTAQLAGFDPGGARLDALRMAADLMKSCRGDHSVLVRHVADQLDASSFEVVAEAATTLEACHVIAEPARESLAQHTTHGPEMWAAPDPLARRAYQNAVRALARLGDDRAVESVKVALDSDTDVWRAVEIAGCLPQAATDLAPRICRHLAGIDLSKQQFGSGIRAPLAALTRFADPATMPTILEALEAAMHYEQSSVAAYALEVLEAFGESAQPEVSRIRKLTSCADGHVRSAAVKALWSIGVEQDEILPLVLEPLNGTTSFWIHDAVEILSQLDPTLAAPAVPRLRELLTDGYEWTRIYAASGLWDIAGASETSVVLDTLLQAWEKNGATANFVVQVLGRMGTAAAPALPQMVAELAQTRRSGQFTSIDMDEELQRVIRDVVGRLA